MLGLNISDDLARRRIIAGPATDTTNGPMMAAAHRGT